MIFLLPRTDKAVQLERFAERQLRFNRDLSDEQRTKFEVLLEDELVFETVLSEFGAKCDHCCSYGSRRERRRFRFGVGWIQFLLDHLDEILAAIAKILDMFDDNVEAGFADLDGEADA